ncbi:MAG: helix-turn-helix domain-containing protein [Oscillospiraceae bacterium]|jgi:transcriptional regulator with XRE-family HTH domain|nr:helix-turn-helix domain-containing protein [Oscillospiraceae bacterium]
MNNRAVGERIKEIRKAHNLTQKQLAEMIGISITHISVIERGVKTPKLETLIDIANAMHVNSDSLLQDVLIISQQVKTSELFELIKDLPPKQQQRILKIVQLLVEDR